MSPPVALLFSAGSVVDGDRKWYTLVTLLISGTITLLMAWSFLTR